MTTLTIDTIVYRDTLPGELADVLALGHEYFAERGMSPDYYEQHKLQSKWELLSMRQSTSLFTAWEDGQCLGGIGLGIFDEECSNERFAGEVFFFIRAEHRGRGIDEVLIQMAETWARRMAVRKIRMGRFSGNRGLGLYYAGKGYQPLRIIHEKELT